MKKTLVYITTAILLGFAVIMLPKTIQSYPSPISTLTNDSRNPPTPEYNESLGTKPSLLISQPSSFLPTSTIIVSGLAVALITYVTLKKRRI